jgi:putative MATE family efflux protein
MSVISLVIAPFLPYWLGGSAEIAHDASLYFAIIGLCGIFFQMEGLAGSMLKCSGNMKIPSILNICMCVMDVIFNYFFIYILDLGVMGAAMGTGVAELITAGLMMYFLLAKSSMLSLVGHPGSFKPKSDTVNTAFKIGAPMGMQHLLMGSAQIVSTLIVAPLGTIAIAAHSLAITVESLCYMPGYGIAHAATTLVGQALGAGMKKLERHFAFLTVAIGMIVMTLAGVLLFIFAPEMISIMSPDENVRELGTIILRIEAFAEPMFGASIVAEGVFRGLGKTGIPSVLNLVSMGIVRLPLSALMAGHFGLIGVWYVMCGELIFRGVIFVIALIRVESRSKIKGDFQADDTNISHFR